MKCKCKEQRLVRVHRTILEKVLGIKEKYKCSACGKLLRVKG
tara:strand:- start:149 stop:274 length:126 start_codon:yes stop_codon:yes gene_type:complete